jgi:hypothetical protein
MIIVVFDREITTKVRIFRYTSFGSSVDVKFKPFISGIFNSLNKG